MNASYQLEGDHILFSIQVVNLEDSKNTGDSIIGSEVIPPVEVFPLQAVQLARLNRVK